MRDLDMGFILYIFLIDANIKKTPSIITAFLDQLTESARSYTLWLFKFSISSSNVIPVNKNLLSTKLKN